MKKSLIAMLLVVSLLFVSCATAPKSGSTPTPPSESTADKPVTIRVMWWGSQTRHDQTIKMIELFMEKNKDVIVEYEYGGFDTYWDKITSMMAGGNAPDVFQNSVAYILNHATSDQLLELDPYITDNTINLSDWDDVFKSLGSINGKTYGLTLGNSSYTSLYDPVLFKEAGIAEPKMNWTWEEYHEALKQIKDKKGISGDTYYPASMLEGYIIYLRQHGYPGLFNAERSALSYAEDDLWIEFFNNQKDMVKKGYIIPYDQTLDALTSLELYGLATGKAGMLGLINSNQAMAIANAKGKPVAFTTPPKTADAKTCGSWIGPTMFFSVPKTTKQPEAAARFINFMLNDVEANKISMMEKGVPASANVRAELESLLSETAAAASAYVGEAAKTVVPYDNIYPLAYSEILDLYKKLCEDMMFDRTSVEDAAKEFNTKANAFLKAKTQ